ncbi:putative hydrolase [Ruaniaceae bacterium KH17]|nr:putative hydrolase [Ruaniaceae bacterium KH17]
MDNGQSWEEVLRSILGEEGASQAIEAMRAAGLDPETMGEAAGVPTDPMQLQAMLAQMRTLFSSPDTGPVNWQLAHDVARQQVHTGGDPIVTAAEDARIRQALQIADLWLDPVTELVAAAPTRRALSRSAWVEETLPVFQDLASPVAEHIVDAISGLLSGEAPPFGDETLGLSMFGDSGGLNAPDLLRKLGSAAFGMQLGGAVAHLASETFGFSDIGVPLGAAGSAAMVPRNVDEFSDGLEVPADQVLQFLALREAAHTRLYGAAPWLRGHVLGIVRNYASEIAIDLPAMEEAFRSIDPTDPEQLRQALGSGIFALEVTQSQRESLENLETVLAVIEGWVECVVTDAALGQIPELPALTEMMRRRRAAGGPAEDAFKTLVGLELRPRRLRDAAAMWTAVTAERGINGRDQLWSHPDLLPNSAALDDPANLGRSDSEFDDALAALLEGGFDDDAPKDD